MKIHVLAENKSIRPDVAAEHGLSLFLERPAGNILFDMGASPSFADNAVKMGVDLTSVELAVISHGHYDHGGGLRRFLEINHHAPVWVSPHAFERHFNGVGKEIGLDKSLENHPRVRVVPSSVFSLGPGLQLVGATEIPPRYPVNNGGMTAMVGEQRFPEDFRHEQHLLLEEDGKRILITGCSHGGILNIAAHFRPNILVGGFHLMHCNPVTDAPALANLAAELMQYADCYRTGHCTGDAAGQVLKERMEQRLHCFSAGQVMEC